MRPRLPPPALAAAASLAATALAGVFVLRRQRLRGRAAERFAAAALETLLNAIDANDPQTGAHVRRVAAYALVLAEEAGLDPAARRTVERVALFHDVGKIHEALFDIIHDSDRLSADERRLIATHPQRGAAVLRPLEGFYPELPRGVLSHHERWDGRGYPRGLRGRRIPLASRILAIADTFDAITHRRRYRGASSTDVARDAIAQGRGTQFDPEMVDLFLAEPVYQRILETAREVAGWTEPVHQRSAGRDEKQVPDIIFRWRPTPRRTRGQRTPGRARRRAR